MKNKLINIYVKVIIIIFVVVLCPMIASAKDAYIVYNDPNGFTTQAKYMASTYSRGYDIYYVRSSSDFVRVWNNLATQSSKIDNLILMLHGGTGVFCFYNENGWNNFNKLSYLGNKINGSVMLLSCNGGTGGGGSVARFISQRSGVSVVSANNSNVNYEWFATKNPCLQDKQNGRWIRTTVVGMQIRSSMLGMYWKYSYLKY